MTIKVDVRGLSCPEPVLKLKQVATTADKIELLADSQVCVDNCSAYARQQGFDVSVEQSDGVFIMLLTKG